MKQLLSLGTALLCIGIVAVVQYRSAAPSEDEAPIQWNLNPSQLHVSADNLAQVLDGPRPAPPELDTLSEAEIMNRLSRLYRYQADILAAEAAERHDYAEQLLDEAVQELSTLLRHPETTHKPRLRELYRTLATEYETYHGLPDTTSLPTDTFYRERERIFTAVSEVAPSSSLDRISGDQLRPHKTSVPLPYNSLVRSAITYLQREPDKHVYRWLRRMETYFPMIEHIFAEEGVPDELKYLALVESGLNPRSESWASAAGLWQFMPTTGRAYGLTITPWVDERLDPEKATRAAARHLKDLHRMFGGDWLLALSGYNCSPTVIRRAIRKARSRLGRKPTFWDIYRDIPRETRNYVPTFVAAALMVSNPTAFELDRVQPGPSYHFDYVPVEGMMTLEKIARLAGVSPDRLRALNPELRRSTTPPSNSPYYVRLPYGTYDQFLASYEALPDEEKRRRLTYRVKSNDTLEKIADRFGVSAADLTEVNDLDHAMIPAGEQLIIPVDHDSPSNQSLIAEADAAPMSVRYSARTVRPLAAIGQRGTSQAGERLVMHRVRQGDTLTEIADRYNVSISEIMQWNGLRSNSLNIGQRLKIYDG